MKAINTLLLTCLQAKMAFVVCRLLILFPVVLFTSTNHNKRRQGKRLCFSLCWKKMIYFVKIESLSPLLCSSFSFAQKKINLNCPIILKNIIKDEFFLNNIIREILEVSFKKNLREILELSLHYILTFCVFISFKH